MLYQLVTLLALSQTHGSLFELDSKKMGTQPDFQISVLPDASVGRYLLPNTDGKLNTSD
jgi:hypothetical protein